MNDIQIIRERQAADAAATAGQIEQLTRRLRELIQQLRAVGLPNATYGLSVPYATVPQPRWYNRKRTVELYENRATWEIHFTGTRMSCSSLYVDTEGQMYTSGFDYHDRPFTNRIDPDAQQLEFAIEYLERIAQEHSASL